jgi:rhodanese-related sulfurtransferase
MENQTLVKEICPTTTKEWVKNGALLVDVREKDEVEQLAYDVPNIINIPLSEFDERYTEVPKDKEVVMVCKGGGRSLRAAGFLVNHGYTNVVNMQHGIIRWAQKGFPTKGDTSSVLGNTQNTGCCDTTSNSSQSCFTPTNEKQKVNMADLGNNCDCSKPGCC